MAGKSHPDLGEKIPGVPGLEDRLQAAFASAVRLGGCHVGIKKGTAEGRDSVDGTLLRLGEEEAGAIGPTCRDQREDAKGLAAMFHDRTRRGQKMGFGPGSEIPVGCVSVQSFQVGRDQVTRDVMAAPRTVPAITLSPGEAEFGARGLDRRQGWLAHGS
jgi:hypothetical protein